MARQIEQFEVELTRTVFDGTTAEWADEQFGSIAMETEFTGLPVDGCAANCGLRATRRGGFIVAQCFPKLYDTLEDAEAQEKRCIAAHEQVSKRHISDEEGADCY